MSILQRFKILLLVTLGGSLLINVILILLAKYGNLELGLLVVGPILVLLGFLASAVTVFFLIKDSLLGKVVYFFLALGISWIMFNAVTVLLSYAGFYKI